MEINDYEDMQESFEELYEDLEKLSLKNISPKNKILSLEKDLRICKKVLKNVKNKRPFLKKRNRGFEKEKLFIDLLSQSFSCGQKAFEMILTRQKCIF